MSRKDYQAFADMIADADYLDAEARKELAEDMARVFKRDNSRFDRERFYAACGIPEEATA